MPPLKQEGRHRGQQQQSGVRVETPLRLGWTEIKQEDGDVYYWHAATGASQVEAPLAVMATRMQNAPTGFVSEVTLWRMAQRWADPEYFQRQKAEKKRQQELRKRKIERARTQALALERRRNLAAKIEAGRVAAEAEAARLARQEELQKREAVAGLITSCNAITSVPAFQRDLMVKLGRQLSFSRRKRAIKWWLRSRA